MRATVEQLLCSRGRVRVGRFECDIHSSFMAMGTTNARYTSNFLLLEWLPECSSDDFARIRSVYPSFHADVGDASSLGHLFFKNRVNHTVSWKNDCRRVSLVSTKGFAKSQAVQRVIKYVKKASPHIVFSDSRNATFASLLSFREANCSVLLQGPPMSGKTVLAKEFVRALGHPKVFPRYGGLFYFQSLTADSTIEELFGKFIPG